MKDIFTTEVWLTPLILLPGVALLIMSTAHRFGQIQTEFHRLLQEHDCHAHVLSRGLLRRSVYFRNALTSLYGAVGLFALGSLLGGVVNLWQPESLWVVGGLTILGIVLIVFAAVQLLRESMLSLEVFEDAREQLEAYGKEGALAMSPRAAE
jgi:hypothetical protein